MSYKKGRRSYKNDLESTKSHHLMAYDCLNKQQSKNGFS